MSIFRDTLPKNLRDSLEARQDAMTDRSPQNIQYLNSRNAWIRMTSAVNINGSAELAKKYVLQGGTLNSNNTLKTGIGTSNELYSTTSPGGQTHRLGIRPMPGITGIDVKSLGAYGSLREITVNFQCWDIRQLEDLEQLYMRTGYTALVEWGWAPYIGPDKKYYPTYTDFFSDELLNPKGYNKEKIFQELYNRCLKTLTSLVRVIISVALSSCVNKLLLTVYTVELHYLLLWARGWSNLSTSHLTFYSHFLLPFCLQASQFANRDSLKPSVILFLTWYEQRPCRHRFRTFHACGSQR